MDEKREIKKSKFDYRLVICIVIAIVVIYLIVSTFLHINSIGQYKETIPYDSAWTYDNGMIVDLDNLKVGEELVIRKKVRGDEISDHMLCFYSKNIYFSVYVDDELIYAFRPNAPSFIGKAYGIFPHAVNLPVRTGDGVIRFEITNIYDDKAGFIREMTLDNGGQFLIELMQDSTMDFLLCLLVFTFGAVLFVVGVIGRYFSEERYEIISLGTFAMVASLWVSSETPIFSLLTGAPVAVHFIDYISLDLLSLPGIIFVASVTRSWKKPVIISFAALTAAKIIFSVISTACGGWDYHELLIVTHILLAIAVIVIIIFVARGLVMRRMRSGLVIALFITLLFSLAMGVIDIIRYMTMQDEYSKASFYRYALFLFILVCGIYEFFRISEMSRRGRYAEIMEELAYEDGLTGLMNRMAFNREIEEASELKSDCTLIMLDMNDLKRVNDELGHDMGDKYISRIAEMMKQAFCHGEKCFRIGGDEFFVMALYGNSDPRFEESLNRMTEQVEDFNRSPDCKVPLGIAYGHAEYVPGEKDIEEQIRLADQKMYEMKAEMKLQYNPG